MSHNTENDASRPPEIFVQQVKEALENLYDVAHLQRLAPEILASILPGDTALPPAQRLRAVLLTAIESLNPGGNIPFRAPQLRVFNLLHLHYIEAMTVQETARELALSERQAYRDLRHAEESVASLLWHERPTAGATSLASEMALIEPRLRSTDLRMPLERAAAAVMRLAARRHVAITIELGGEPLVASLDPVLAHQVLVHLLSATVQHALPGPLRVTAGPGHVGISVQLGFTPVQPLAILPELPAVRELATLLHWYMHEQTLEGGVHRITIDIQLLGPVVMVVDDNAGLASLLERFLTGHTCRVLGALGGRQGLELAFEVEPDAIILDVMMPDIDGWELLQRLRAHPATATCPIIVCSVLHDPELALSLGATDVLSKPVDRAAFLKALHGLGVI